mmetsp:Transcript_34328/g.52603  ORF Transcript_34328/g.52603 Transcript_34328/m.52603 type:complete len:84 (-) Transcript_34328:644-895(-)
MKLGSPSTINRNLSTNFAGGGKGITKTKTLKAGGNRLKFGTRKKASKKSSLTVGGTSGSMKNLMQAILTEITAVREDIRSQGL